MIDPKPANPASARGMDSGTNAGTRAGGKKRRFGGTEAQIRSALKFYKVLAYLTGRMLLLLCAELVARYGFGQYLFAGGTNAVTGQPFGFGFADAEPPGGGLGRDRDRAPVVPVGVGVPEGERESRQRPRQVG